MLYAFRISIYSTLSNLQSAIKLKVLQKKYFEIMKLDLKLFDMYNIGLTCNIL